MHALRSLGPKTPKDAKSASSRVGQPLRRSVGLVTQGPHTGDVCWEASPSPTPVSAEVDGRNSSPTTVASSGAWFWLWGRLEDLLAVELAEPPRVLSGELGERGKSPRGWAEVGMERMSMLDAVMCEPSERPPAACSDALSLTARTARRACARPSPSLG